MRDRTCRQWAVLAVIVGMPWGFVAGQEDLPGFDQQVRERVLEILPQLREEDWSRRESESGCHYFATMLTEELEVGQPGFVIILARDEDRKRSREAIPCRIENLRLVDEDNVLAPVTLQWRRYSMGLGWRLSTDWRIRKVKWPEASVGNKPALAGAEIWAFELTELFDLSRAGSYALQFTPTFGFPDVPHEPNLRCSFRVIDPEE